MRCPSCCNPEMLPFKGGTATPVMEVVQQIEATVREYPIEGITLLGGEPIAHAASAAGFDVPCETARDLAEVVTKVEAFPAGR